MWVESSPVALVSQPLTFTVLYHPLATQSHGPAQTHQGPVGGPDPGVARRTSWDAQVSAGFPTCLLLRGLQVVLSKWSA